MVRELHQLSRSRSAFRLDVHGADRVDVDGFLVALLLLDEVVVCTTLLKHVGGVHGAAIRFVEEMCQIRPAGAQNLDPVRKPLNARRGIRPLIRAMKHS